MFEPGDTVLASLGGRWTRAEVLGIVTGGYSIRALEGPDKGLRFRLPASAVRETGAARIARMPGHEALEVEWVLTKKGRSDAKTRPEKYSRLGRTILRVMLAAEDKPLSGEVILRTALGQGGKELRPRFVGGSVQVKEVAWKIKETQLDPEVLVGLKDLGAITESGLAK